MRFDYSDFNSKRATNKKNLEKMVQDAATKLTLDVDRNLKLVTPVDTGEARGGWTATTPTKPFENGTVENNVPHIVPLWNGHSSQAPAGTFDNAIQAAVKGK